MEGFEYTALHITQHKRFGWYAPEFLLRKNFFYTGNVIWNHE